MLVNLAGSLQRSLNQAFKIMAKAVFSEIISDLRGKIGNHVWSAWKGIAVLKLAPKKMDYAWGSAFTAPHRALIKDCTYRWKKVLSQEQKASWEEYAQYLGTIRTDYVKLSGLKQFGGTMSGFNAYTLNSSFRRSIGKPDFRDEAPLEIESPPQPDFTTFPVFPGPPLQLGATFHIPAYLPETSWLRAWCRGTQYAHLIIAKSELITGGPEPDWDVSYEANELPPAATPPWELSGAETSTIEYGILHLNHPPEEGQYTIYVRQGEAWTDLWTAEAKIKIVTAGPRLEFEFKRLIAPGTGRIVKLVLYPDKVAISCASYGEYAMDTTLAYHTYRVVNNIDSVKLFVDGNLVISLTDENVEQEDTWIAWPYALPLAHSEMYLDYLRYSIDEAIEPVVEGILKWDKMRYAKGAEADILPDTYKCQLDIIGESGRFSPPSEIKTVRVT